MEQKKQEQFLQDWMRFMDGAPTAFHAVKEAGEKLRAAGVIPLQEREVWKLQPGQGYYVTRNGSSLLAFRMPAGEWKGFHIFAAHSDSPCFKIKENPEMAVEKQYVKLNVERYGGMIMSSWLDRPLSVAGRAMVRQRDGFEEKLVDLAEETFVIPNLAIHMNREMNNGFVYKPQTDMLPLFGGFEGKPMLKGLIAEKLGVGQEDILSSDLYLYSKQPAVRMGARGEFVGAPRLDDLQCVYAGLSAMADSAKNSADSESVAADRAYLPVLAIFDNEEVGSGTKQGAASTFLKDVLERIAGQCGLPAENYRQKLAESFVISGDNAHAVHPNHPEKADPTNRPYLNRGIVIKYSGNQKYATDAYSAACFKLLCKEAGVPVQAYVNHSDVPGGSTLGNISTAQVSIPTVDIGLPQLAMHSAFETAGVEDTLGLYRVLRLFFAI